MSERLSNTQPNAAAMVPGAALNVEVIADLVCPFCFLGKRRLDEALRAVQGPNEVRWLPWQLNPEMPEEGVAFDDYLARRFGDPAAIEPVLNGLAEEGRRAGIVFRFDRLTRVPNTRRAHQVMHLAESEGRDPSFLADDLLSAFFERGENIGDPDVLAGLAARHELARGDVLQAIEDEAARQIVLTRESRLRSSGIAGVPGFLLNRRLLMVGVQDVDAMINAFDRAMFGEGSDELVSPGLH